MNRQNQCQDVFIYTIVMCTTIILCYCHVYTTYLYNLGKYTILALQSQVTKFPGVVKCTKKSLNLFVITTNQFSTTEVSFYSSSIYRVNLYIYTQYFWGNYLSSVILENFLMTWSKITLFCGINYARIKRRLMLLDNKWVWFKLLYS